MINNRVMLQSGMIIFKVVYLFYLFYSIQCGIFVFLVLFYFSAL